MKPYYEEAGITIWHGDCLEVLPRCGAVDHVITDPPYEAEAHTAGRRLNGRVAELAISSKREIDAAPLSFAPMDERTRVEVSAEIGRLCSGWALVFCQAEAVAIWRDSLSAFGASYKRSMVWVKPDGAPQLSGDRPGMGYESIVASWAGAGRSVWNGGGKRGVFIHNKRDVGAAGPNQHQTQKPISLMIELVELFTEEGQTILDPFMGSGTTLLAAKSCWRKAIGIELEEKYCEIAANRLRQSVFNFEEIA
jgi:site-specific DNA-methyltransferase (adenine-specific)